VEKELLEWIGHHPYLSSSELSVLLNLKQAVIEEHLLNLLKSDLASSIVRGVQGEAIPTPRYFLTQDGLKFLATRDGVPHRRYGRYGVLAAEGGSGRANDGWRLAGLLRHFDHTVGANSYFVRLAAEARESSRRGTHRFVAWLNAAEGQEWFRWRDRSWHIWPDGRAIYEVDGRRYDVLLEWDRGLMHRRDLLEKFQGYESWLEARGSKSALNIKLLFVTTSPGRVSTLLEIAAVSPRLVEVVLATGRDQWVHHGALGACWLRPCPGAPARWWDAVHAERPGNQSRAVEAQKKAVDFFDSEPGWY
jgi:hypothetical protein